VFDGTFARGPVSDLVSGAAWVQSLLAVEAALARAACLAGAIPSSSVAAIEQACADPSAYDAGELAREASDSGSPVVPLVARLRERVPQAAAADVHFGATSQDILDTAMVLIARRAVAAIAVDLAVAADACAELAAHHRTAPIIGRSLMQAALPTTFGLKAAVWMRALDGGRSRLVGVAANLPVQYGGPVGTLASAGRFGSAIRANLAADLGLTTTPVAWHTDRTPVLELAGALAIASAALGSTALDLVLLAQSEVGEVSEGVSGRGGSSSMPHKHNPIAAISARACGVRAPGLVATLIAASAQEHERGAGGWHAEWETSSDLLRLVGSAASWLADSVSHLEVHADVMRTRVLQSLGDNGSHPLEADVRAAAERVDEALSQRPTVAS
jgi:3-carboxy-cis,cis-muconate cycloisomerase